MLISPCGDLRTFKGENGIFMSPCINEYCIVLYIVGPFDQK